MSQQSQQQGAVNHGLTLIVSLLLMLCCIILAYSSPSDHCDPLLRKDADNPLGYQPRGDRCEGLYVQDVGNTLLMVASFTEQFENFGPVHGESLRIAWPPAVKNAVRLRAVSLKPRLYYRMDSLRPAGTESYVLPPGVISALEITKADIGIIGWIDKPIGEAMRRILLPLRVGEKNSDEKHDDYELVLIPGAELSEVFLSLAPVHQDIRLGNPVLNGQPLSYGYYPADRAIRVHLKEIGNPGLYYLEIAAQLKSGLPTSTRLWFYHDSGNLNNEKGQ